MPEPGRPAPRLRSSAAVPLLAASAAVLAHLVAAGHRPDAVVLLATVAALGVADAVLATVLRGGWAVLLRMTVLQVCAHGVLSTAAAVTGTTHPRAAGHHAVTLAAPDATASLLPSAPMLTAHVAVAVVVAVLLTRTSAGTRAALTVPALVRAVAVLVRLMLPPTAPVVRVRLVRVRDDHPVVPARERVWTGASPVRRGPPVLV